VLIDTNVLVYANDPADTIKQDRALEILKFLEMRRLGRLSVQCLAEFLHVTTRSRRKLLTPAEAIQQTVHLMRAYPVFDLTPLVVLEAGRGVRDHNLAYSDAQIWAAARLNQVTVVFSEDFSDGQVLEGVRFVNPFSADFHLEEWV
jgi:predicted nucleic acid-binding protein